jgi:translation initiation factor 3 subunit E
MEEQGMEQWDLTSRVAPHVDLHMMFPLLEYLDTLINSGLIAYSSTDVATARLALLRPTHMVDYAIDIYKSLHGENAPVPPEMEEQKQQVYQRLEELRAGCNSLDELCRNTEERVSRSRSHSHSHSHHNAIRALLSPLL